MKYLLALCTVLIAATAMAGTPQPPKAPEVATGDAVAGMRPVSGDLVSNVERALTRLTVSQAAPTGCAHRGPTGELTDSRSIGSPPPLARRR